MEMRKILYVTFAINAPNNGATVVIRRNFRMVSRIFATDQVFLKEIPAPSLESMLQSLFTFSSYGVSPVIENELVRMVQEKGIDLIFVEGTLLGNLIKRLKKISSSVRTVVFVHNIDRLLYRQQFKLSKSFISLIKYKFVGYNEEKTFAYADHIIVLNQRDRKQLKAIYGRESDAIIPISCPSHVQMPSISSLTKNRPYCLFVGSDFFPNNFGIKWFIRHVAPYISLDLWVVGSCFQALASSASSLPGNVYLKGFVDDLETCYANAECVVAPIFQGSGMKTKVVEALSYAKTIFATEEAWQGIEGDRQSLGGECRTAEEFIVALNAYAGGKYNLYAADIFRTYYSDETIYGAFQSFFDKFF